MQSFCISVFILYGSKDRKVVHVDMFVLSVPAVIVVPVIVVNISPMAMQWRIQGGGGGGESMGGLCPPPPLLDFFLQIQSLLAKISTKRAQNLSQNAGNGHFRDSKFKKFRGEHAPTPP